MTSLLEMQKELKRVLVQPGEIPATALWPQGPPTRLRVYRNNIRTNWFDTLEGDFPLTRKQFEPRAWNRLVCDYFVKEPPRHWELNRSMSPFVAYLQGQPVPAYVKELAEYEWQDLVLFIHPAQVSFAKRRTNPTAVARLFQYQIFDWVESGALPGQPPKKEAEVLVFYRDRHHRCHVRAADPLMLLMMNHFQNPKTTLAALEPIRKRLLPTNRIPLQKAFDLLKRQEVLIF